MERGKKEGIEEGMAKGVQEGMKKITERVIRNMLSKGTEPSRIAELTGVKPDVIEALKAELESVES